MNGVTAGPKKIVLLSAGKYDFAEVELSEPIHLVGPNNVGKTSLIAALQFLYIDSQNQMHFGRDMRETRKYYFPGTFSFVLFECLTPSGYRVIGAHGKGPLHQYEFERFTYTGTLDLNDFLDGSNGQSLERREWDETRLRLSDREFRFLEPRDLRAGLTGAAAREGQVSFGLLPLAQRASYDRFSRVFRNLLRLSQVTQHELKELLVDIFDREFRQRELNLDGDYRQQFEGVRRGWRELAVMRELQAEIDEMLDKAANRDRLRALMPGVWRALLQAADHEKNEAKKKIEGLHTEQAEMKAQLLTLEAEHAQMLRCLETLATERGTLEEKLKDLASRREEFGGFDVNLARMEELNLSQAMRRIDGALAIAAGSDRERLQARHLRLVRQVDSFARMIDHDLETVGQLLARRMEMAKVEATFSLLNPSLLGLPVSNDPEFGVVVDPELLSDKVCSLAERFDEQGYSDDVATIRWKWLERATLDEQMGRHTLLGQYESAKSELVEVAAQMETAGRLRELEEEHNHLKKERDALVMRLARFEETEVLAANETVWTGRKTAIAKEQAALEVQQQRLINAHTDVGLTAAAMQETSDRLKRKLDIVRQTMSSLTPPNPAWQSDRDEPTACAYETLVERYVNDSREERRLHIRVGELGALIDRQTDGRFPSGNEEEAIGRLKDERAAFPQRENALQEMWKSLLAALRTGLTALNRDVDALKSRVDALNRQLSRHGVSDLEQLWLDVQETKELLLVREVAKHEESPLLTDRKSAERALQRIGDLLREYPRIGLLSLFDLHFHVTTPGGVAKKYADLEKVESNGTTVTIKVLVNLLLLRGLIAEKEAGHVQIPFYLDEVASLDARNRQAVIALARELGFVPILASPEPLEGAENVYFVKDWGGRIQLDAKGARVKVLRGHG